MEKIIVIFDADDKGFSLLHCQDDRWVWQHKWPDRVLVVGPYDNVDSAIAYGQDYWEKGL